jgi:LmbE family N-acetylglucosaminyl deacetylase
MTTSGMRAAPRPRAAAARAGGRVSGDDGGVAICWVFFHAHPDDEVLLTAGTMARLSAAGVRVVLVVATAGERGLTTRIGADSAAADLGTVRLREQREAAAVLGCARVVCLGYADSGSVVTDCPQAGSFAAAEVDGAARRLAEILCEEAADVLTIYDPAGGYGHPDHVQVHRVGSAAADLAGTARLLEATVDRDLLRWGTRLVSHLPGISFDVATLSTAYVDRSEITHRIDVRGVARVKRRAMAAHVSQRSGGETMRLLNLLVRLPLPVFRAVLGTEWYVDRRDPGRPLPLSTGPG